MAAEALQLHQVLGMRCYSGAKHLLNSLVAKTFLCVCVDSPFVEKLICMTTLGHPYGLVPAGRRAGG